jgi:hypothetical protein
MSNNSTSSNNYASSTNLMNKISSKELEKDQLKLSFNAK